MKVIPPPQSTGMKIIRLLDFQAFAVKRNNARVSNLAKDGSVTIRNTASELRGLDRQSLRLYYLDESDRRWKPVASQFDNATLTLTAPTNHFSYYGEQANPAISGPGTVMAFETDLHSGTLKMSYPLELPPGPGGFRPRLQLSYDGGRADGMKNKRSLGSWVGIGWSLHPGYISYDDESNKYSMEIGGYGYEILRSGNNYFTRPDLFYKIIRDEANQKWEVWDRSGVYYRFGGTTQSAQYYQKSPGPPVENVYYRWDLNLITDPHGNAASITYNQYEFNGSVRSSYPTQMTYGYNTVTFTSTFDGYPNPDPTYGELRKDNPIGVIGGVPIPKVMENRQLDSVDIKVNGVRARKYNLSYLTTDRVYSAEYQGIYYSGTHSLTGITLVGADGASTLPAMTFSYANLQTYYRDSDNPVYSGNPGNPASLYWPRLGYVSNGYGAQAWFTHSQKPATTEINTWTRQVIVSRRLNPGIGPEVTYTYDYDGNPEYLGEGWTASYRGFRKVKETDAAGHFQEHYFHTTGYDAVNNKDWEKLTGREYLAKQFKLGDDAATSTPQRTTTSNWNWNTSNFWTDISTGNSSFTLLHKWDGHNPNNGKFSGPWGITADGSGNIFVVDNGNTRIQKFTGAGAFLTRWSVANPIDATLSTDGKVSVADSAGYIKKYDVNGVYQTQFPVNSPLAVASYDYNTYTLAASGPYLEAWNSAGSFIWRTGGYGSGNGQFISPYGVAADPNGNIWVADTGNNRLQKFDSNGNHLATYGGPNPGTGDYEYNQPYGIAVDSGGYVYVADTGNNRVMRYRSDFVIDYIWVSAGGPGGGDNQFNSPRHLTVQGGYVFVTDAGNNRIQKLRISDTSFNSRWGGYGTVEGPFSFATDVAQSGGATYVADTQTHYVKKFDAYGANLAKIGGQGTGNGQLTSPYGVAASAAGNLYVADTGNNRIQKFDGGGAFVAKYPNGSGSLNGPYDLAVFQGQSNTYVYAVDTNNHLVKKFEDLGNSFQYLTEWGGYGTSTAQLSSPRGVAVDGQGFVYVADSGNHRIKKYSANGGEPLWIKGKTDGSGNPVSGAGDGEFNNPVRVAADAAGNVYVADTGNHRIQKLDSQGNVIAKFGQQGSLDEQFSSPYGIDVSADGGFIYVADTGNQRVQKLAPLWEVRLEETTDTTLGTKTEKTRYSHDGKGNIAAAFRDGDIGAADDDATVWRLFQQNITSPYWVLDKVSRERVYEGYRSTDNGTGYKVEARYFYDGAASYTTPPTKGDLTQIEKYDPAPGSSPNLLTFKKTYDTYGNVKTETNANDRKTDYTYEITYNTFLVEKKLPALAGQQEGDRMKETYAWDYTGARMTSETDVNNVTTSYEYDTFWRPIKLRRPGDESPATPTIEHQYNNSGTISYQHVNTIQKIDGSSNLWSKKYFDGLGRVVQVQAKGEGGNAIVTTTTFDYRGLVDKEYVPQDLASPGGYTPPPASPPLWKNTSYVYDSLRRVTTTTKPDATTVSHDYGVPWQDLAANERGKKKRYYFDAFERLSKVEELDDAFAVYATTVYAYDFQDNLVKVTDAAGNETVSTYNGFARKVSMRDPDMGQWVYEYDAQGNLTKQTDANNKAITFSYDAFDRLTRKSYPPGSQPATDAVYTYDDVSSGNMGKGRRTGMTDSSGSMAYKYDSRGRLSQETRTVDGTPYTTAYAYDSADRQVTVTYPTGEVVTNGYNGRGLPSSLSSSASGTIVSSTLYNSLALPTELNLGNNTKTTYGYWGLGGQYDNPGNYYGKLWEIKTVKVGANTLQDVKHTWDATGNLTQRENVLDVEKETFGYDFLDRLTSAYNYLFTFGNTGGPPNTVTTPWKAAVDNSGNIWVADTGNNRIAKYNSSGVYQTYFGSYGTENGKFDQPSGVALDSSGNIYVSDYNNHRIQKFNSSFEHQWSRGVFGSGNGEFISPADIVFNPSSGFLYVADSANHRIQYFDTSGNYQGQWGGWGSGDSQFKYPFGVGVDASGSVYVADMFNRKIKKFSTTGSPLGNWGATGSGPGQFQYPRDVAVDASGNIFVADTSNHRIQKIAPTGQYTYNFIMMWGSSGSGQSQFSSPYGVALTSARIYVVDTNNSRLQTFDSQTTTGWAYNQIGNMTLRDGVAYTYGSKPHAVTLAGSTSYVYDANGNMTNRGAQQLAWDVENRLIKIDGVPTYVYDGNGFRVKKTEGGVTTLYINKYYEKRLSDGTVTLYYYLGDKMVAFKEGATLRYIHQDHLTSTSVVTDASGTIVNTIKYKAYGEARGTLPDSPAQKFTGQQLDDIGLYYYGARYYDAALGRFLSADTIVPGISNPQSLNRYSYVLNNPLRYVDPTGNQEEEEEEKKKKDESGGGNDWWDAFGKWSEATIKGLGDAALNLLRLAYVPYYMHEHPEEVIAAFRRASSDPVGTVTATARGIGADYSSRWQTTRGKASIFGEAGIDLLLLALTGGGSAGVKAGGRVFWSGVGAKEAARSWAMKTGRATIEMTDAGKALEVASEGMTRAQKYTLWASASRKFAEGAAGEVHVFHAAGGVSRESIWATVEYQALMKNPNVTDVVYHVVLPNGKIILVR